jgi:VCBS repeat-containing protein
VTDANGDISAANACVTVTPVNDPPTVSAIANTNTNEDTATGPIAFTIGDVDSPLGSLAVTAHSGDQSIVADAGIAVAGSGANRTVTVTPVANANGPVTITVNVSDGSASSNSPFVLTVIPVNDLPVATAASAQTNEDTVLNGSVSANDVDGDPLTYAKVADPAHGAVVVNANGTYTYTPVANYHGPDSFTFKANDGTGDSAPATITITVNSVNDAPVANAGVLTNNEDTPNTGTVAAGDVDGDTLTYSVVAGPAHGILTAFDPATGAYTYAPAADYNGPDSFTFKANDGSADSNVATVTITVNAVNDAPVAVADSVNYTGPGMTFNVRANDTDVDNPTNSLTVTLTSPSANGGTISCDTSGTCTYTAPAGFHGADTFTYQVSDGSLTSQATVTVNIP